jgi:hypothetical protein
MTFGNYELGRIWKDELMVYLRNNLNVCLEDLRKSSKNLVQEKPFRMRLKLETS